LQKLKKMKNLVLIAVLFCANLVLAGQTLLSKTREKPVPQN